MTEVTGENIFPLGEKSLCFQEAIEALENKNISEAIYYSQLLAHYGGERHPDDHKVTSPGDLEFAQAKTEEVAYQVRLTALAGGYEAFSPSEVQLSEHLFQSCVDGDLEQVKSEVERLKDRRSLLIQPLSALAAKKSQSSVFQFCFKQAQEIGIDIKFPLKRAVFQMPQTLDFLLEQNWEDIQNSPKALELFMSSSLLTCADTDRPAEVLRWTLAHGVKIPSREYGQMAYAPPRPDVLRVLLDINPKAILQTGMLQYAAGRADIDLVKTLIDAGANVNQAPPSVGDVRESGPWTALYMVVDNPERTSKEEDKYIEIARLLLDKGADMNKNGLPNKYKKETPLQAAERVGNSHMIALFKEYQ